MAKYFSPSKNAFFDDTLNTSIPTDAKTIDPTVYANLMAQMASQAVELTADGNGNPAVVARDSLLSLAAAQQQRASDLAAACQSAITAGFKSSALGQPNYYGSLQTDQINLQRMFATSQTVRPPSSYPIYCSPTPMQNPPFVQHTQAQMLQVLADLNAWITAQQEKYNELVQQVQAAKTIAAVQAIVWS